MGRSSVFLALGLTISGACLAGQASAAEAGNAYPTTAVLDAVRTACSDLSSLAAAQARVEASGWVRAADVDATPIGPLVRFGYATGERMVKGRGKLDAAPRVYSRTVAGETLHLIVSAAQLGGTTVTGCRAYDADEARALDAAAAARWVGRAPNQTVDRPELTRLTWEPGVLPGQDSFEIFRIPAGSPAIAITKLAGIAFKADQVGTVQP